ncbi:MAG: metalloregulator ArsR/SmtB family transcription factor [Thermoleophilia bacterium]|nr:metalloregulator ArsR/SmtB family transcription factor [Thermoleophilia bacterium]
MQSDGPIPRLEETPGGCCGGGSAPGLPLERATDLSESLQVLGHPIRLQILDILARRGGEVCVCDLEAALPVKQPTVSHHLRILREAGLVGAERRGQWAHYYVCPDALSAVETEIRAWFQSVG